VRISSTETADTIVQPGRQILTGARFKGRREGSNWDIAQSGILRKKSPKREKKIKRKSWKGSEELGRLNKKYSQDELRRIGLLSPRRPDIASVLIGWQVQVRDFDLQSV